MIIYEYSNIVLATHAFLVDGKFTVRSGPTIPMLDYFLPRCKRFFLIGQPPPFVEDSLAPFLFVYESGRLKKTFYNKWLGSLYGIPVEKRQTKTSFRLKLRDIFSVFYFSCIIKRIIGKEAIDYFIGVESVNAVAIGLSKIFLPVNASVYYAFDWSITWFENTVLNYLYIQFDKWACRLSDFNWNTSHRIMNARRNILRYNDRVLGRQMTVPFGMMTFQEDLVRNAPEGQLNTVVYCGELSCENGATLLPDIAHSLWEINQGIRLLIIGGGELLNGVMNKTKELGLSNIEFKGHISDQTEIDKILASCHVGIAPYPTFSYSKKRFGDVVKIRNYFACGLPVITTDVPPIADEILDENLGRVVQPDPIEIAAQCHAILADRKDYMMIRGDVINKARAYHWKKIYDRTFENMSLGNIKRSPIWA